MPSNILEGRILKKSKRYASLRKCVCFLFNFLVVANKNLVFFLCALCVVLIFECILLQCEFAKDIISLDFSPLLFSFILFLNCDQFCSENWK